jgi:diacylglycerol kinase family enzyme
VLRDGKARRVDAGHARYAAATARPADSYFVNAASFGVSGRVVELAQNGPRRLGGTARVRGRDRARAARYRARASRSRVDGELAVDRPTALVAAANGRHFGSGMQIAPDARLDDGGSTSSGSRAASGLR